MEFVNKVLDNTEAIRHPLVAWNARNAKEYLTDAENYDGLTQQEVDEKFEEQGENAVFELRQYATDEDEFDEQVGRASKYRNLTS